MKIKRDLYLQRLINRIDNGMIKVITGIRRSGKSYLIFKIFKSYFRFIYFYHKLFLIYLEFSLINLILFSIIWMDNIVTLNARINLSPLKKSLPCIHSFRILSELLLYIK